MRVFYRRLPGEGSAVSASFQTAGPSVLIGELDGAAARWPGLTFRAVANHRDDRDFAGTGALSKADLTANGGGPARFGSDTYSAQLRRTTPLPATLHPALHRHLLR